MAGARCRHVQVMYQIALLGRRDLALAPDEYAGFTMAVLRMLSFVAPQARSQAAARRGATRALRAPRLAPRRPRRNRGACGRRTAARGRNLPRGSPAVSFDGDWRASSSA
jgi:DNA polymerase-3 subunit gamma/tau